MNKIYSSLFKVQKITTKSQYFYKPRLFKKPGVDFVKQTKGYKEQVRIHNFYNYGLYAAVFGACFGMVPLYRLFCEHVGISGDYEQKDYSVKSTDTQNKHRKFRIRFKSEADPEVNWEFEQVQDELFINAGETALMFYRAYNAEPDPVIGFATYNVYPEEAQTYFSKIQCFCFNQQLLNPKEELQLPLYFYIEPEILDDHVLQDTYEIRIIYQFLKCAKQDMLQYVEEELERVRKNKEFLAELREKKLEAQGIVSQEEKKQKLELVQLKQMEDDLLEKKKVIENTPASQFKQEKSEK